MLLWRNPTQYMCGCGFGNHIEPSYWTLKWFVIFLPLVVTFHLFRSLWGHCGQLSKKCVGPGATRESPYGHLDPLWPQTHLIPCGKANWSHTGKFGTPHYQTLALLGASTTGILGLLGLELVAPIKTNILVDPSTTSLGLLGTSPLISHFCSKYFTYKKL